jgi:hypothetical protein
LSISSARGRVSPDLPQSAVPLNLCSIAIPCTSLPSMAIKSSSREETEVSLGLYALDFVAVSSVIPEPDSTSLPSMVIGSSLSQHETGLLLSCIQAPSASASAAASIVIPEPDNIYMVTVGNNLAPVWFPYLVLCLV